jgi:hypothetical protein
MAGIKLPFWVVSERQVEREAAHLPCGDPAAIHAFTSTVRLTDYLDRRKSGNWEVSLVGNREALILAIADVHRTGAATLCFDPNADGSGGDAISLSALLVILDRQPPG